jgi:hypothetical protein
MVSLLSFVGAAGGDDADILAPFRECDMIQISSQWTEQVESPFPVFSPCVFLDKPLWVRKAREDIKEIEATPSHIALPLGFIPFITHTLCMHTLSALVKARHELTILFFHASRAILGLLWESYATTVSPQRHRGHCAARSSWKEHR